MSVHADNVEGWKIQRDEIRKGTGVCVINGKTSCPGTYCVEFVHHWLPYPAAMLWFRFGRNGTQIEILNIYTLEPLRRCGLGRRMVEFLFRFYPKAEMICSDAASPLGFKWMTALGFKRQNNAWELLRKKMR